MKSIEEIINVKELFLKDDKILLELLLDTKNTYIDAKHNNNMLEEYDKNLYKLYLKLQDLELFDDAIAVLYGLAEVAIYDNNDRYASIYYCSIAAILRNLKQYDKALEVVTQALDVCSKYSIIDSCLGTVYLTYAAIYEYMDNQDAMKEYQNRALSAHKRSIQRHIKRCDKEPIDDDEKLILLCNRYCLLEGLCSDDMRSYSDDDIVASCVDIADIYRGMERYAEAFIYYEFVFEMRKRTFGEIESIIRFCDVESLERAEVAYESIAWAYCYIEDEQTYSYFETLYRIQTALYSKDNRKTISTAETVDMVSPYVE